METLDLAARLEGTAYAYRAQATLFSGRRAAWRLARADALIERANALICEHDPKDVFFVGHIAAPGYGKAWECGNCHEPMWGMTADSATPYRDLDGVPELSLEDII
jgi:hypothetical protein